jgi:predicted house-cleaning NTP pyrophosphatase (Maf/HAM1 superfamily)
MLEDDKKSLVNLLDWIGIRGVDKADNGLLNSVFVNWLSVDERQNTKQFLEVYEEYYKSSAGQKVVEVYNHLKNLTKQNRVVVSKEGVTLGDTILEEAKDLKQAAKLIAKNKTHLATLSQLIEAK